MHLRQSSHRTSFSGSIAALSKAFTLLAVLASSLVAVNPASAIESPTASFTPQQVRPITLPIAASAVSDVHWSDTFGAARSGGRSHVGVDMLGPKMTPLIAAADGTITWMRSNGNNMLVITDSDGWEYWYIHINNDTPGTDDGANNYNEAFAPGIEVGAEVVAGQVVAYMGDSGNAENSGSHLHFEIETPDGRNLNPTLSVDDALARLDQIDVDDALVAPFPSFDVMVNQVYAILVGRPATATERQALAQSVINDGLFASLALFVDADTEVAAIDRLYFAVFNRLPDLDGYQYWIEQGARSLTLEEMSELFADSEEYRIRFDGESFETLLDQIYLELFDRAPDEGGKAYWLEQLEDGKVTRGTIILYFSQGEEARNSAGARGELVALTAALEGRMPTPQEIAVWEAARLSSSFAQVAQGHFS